MESLRFDLDPSEIPTRCDNVAADMPNAPTSPPGADGRRVSPEQLAAVFPQAIRASLSRLPKFG